MGATKVHGLKKGLCRSTRTGRKSRDARSTSPENWEDAPGRASRRVASDAGGAGERKFLRRLRTADENASIIAGFCVVFVRITN
ncbi:hypothetical protein NQ318_018871 [Aromia moschata]|uniref:Uncharacterized protein n=1 Tax=Aromia moschata TaxID=1265417 RepID=A0AAV8ZI22_9CUCU|nr:hypothetical protein NQ318_018871 [Aromia moschata]